MESTPFARDTRHAADEAMSRYARGADDAFARLYAVVTPRLTRLLYRLMRDRSRVPDLIQETFLRVHRARRTFVPGTSAMAWISTIARHVAIDAHRAPAREQGADPECLEHLFQRAPAEMSPTGEQMLIAQEVAAHLGRAFDRLPEGQRAALRLVRSEGLSVAEAAAALGTTAAGVNLRTHKACRRLRAELGGEIAA